MKGRLYLIPSPLGDNDPAEVLPASTLAKARELKCFVVEEIRTARRFLSRAGLKGHIEELEFHELNEHTDVAEVEAMSELFEKGDVGLISEAGLPAVADPGAALVDLCHRKGLEVVPMVGPSSLMLALMASGLNGQSFAFCGYLPAKTDERRNALKECEKRSRSLHQSQIIIETPYRNNRLIGELAKALRRDLRLCVAYDITGADEWIVTRTIAEWEKTQPTLAKKPAIFLLYK